MPNQKLPLFGGIIAPVHNGVLAPGVPVAAIPAVVGGTPDKNLSPQGVQSFYEMHLWLKPGGDGTELYTLYAQDDNNPAYLRTIWVGTLATAFGGLTNSPAIKILDGYPIRGNVTLYLAINTTGVASIDQYPAGPQVWGYYYYVGEGTPHQPERRFIGEPSTDGGLTVGFPMLLVADDHKVIHTFEQNHIDELSLAISLALPSVNALSALVELHFEDANGVPLIAGHVVRLSILPTVANRFRDPESVYTIHQIPLGGGISPAGLPNPNQLAISVNPGSTPVVAHGYFTRR